MKSHNTPFIVTLFAILALGLGGIAASLAESRPSMPSPYPVLKNETRSYEVEVIADLKQLLKEHGDDSRMLRVIDHDAQTIIYVLLNDTGEMFTGLQAVSRTSISIYSPIYQRLWK